MLIRPLLKERFGKKYGLELWMSFPFFLVMNRIRVLNSSNKKLNIENIRFMEIKSIGPTKKNKKEYLVLREILGRPEKAFFLYDADHSFLYINGLEYFIISKSLAIVMKNLYDKTSIIPFFSSNEMTTNFRIPSYVVHRDKRKFNGYIFFRSYEFFLEFIKEWVMGYSQVLKKIMKEIKKMEKLLEMDKEIGASKLYDVELKSVFLPVSDSYIENDCHIIYQGNISSVRRYMLFTDGYTSVKKVYNNDKEEFRHKLSMTKKPNFYLRKKYAEYPITDKEKDFYEKGVKKFLEELEIPQNEVKIILP